MNMSVLISGESRAGSRSSPMQWPTWRLKYLTSHVGSGKTPRGGAEVYQDSGILLIRSQNVHIDGLRLEDAVFIDDATDEELRASRVRPADVLLNITGASLGRCAWVCNDIGRANVNQHVCIIRPIRRVLEPAFLHYALVSDKLQSMIFASENGISREGLNFRQIGNFDIPNPPLDEQRAIGTFLDRETARIDPLIAKKQRLIELLKEQRQAVISRAVTKGRDPSAPMKPSGIDWLGDVPQHWTVRAFRYSARIANGQVDPERPEYCDLPLIAPNHIESGTGRLLTYDSAAEQAAESGKYLFETGNVLYSKIRPALAKVCMAPERGLCSADMYPITPRTDLRPLYLMYYMLSVEFTTGVVLLSSRVAMPKMNRRDLGSFAVLVPPLDEQDEIVAHLREQHAKIDSAREVVEIAIDSLRQYRSALITAAVHGQIDVRQQGKEAT